MRLRIATCMHLPEPDADERPLLEALHAAGVEAVLQAWDDPSLNWDEPVPTLLRSTWNYHRRHADFLAWIERVTRAALLLNPADIVRWNSHKSYLLDLAARAIPIVPTEIVPRASRCDLVRLVSTHGWERIVIKPAVSASSFATRAFEPGRGRGRDGDGDGWAAAQAHLEALLAERDALVQPYVDSVEEYGERAVVWIDGMVTHAVRKQPRFGGEDEAVSTALAVAEDERTLANAILAPWRDRLLYARVDLARDAAGRPMVMELELIEPSLFLVQCGPALQRFVDALGTRLAR